VTKRKDNISKYNKRLTPEESSEKSRKAGLASGKSRRENKVLREALLNKISEADWDQIVDGVIERAKHSTKDFITLRDTIGQKPKQEVSVSDPAQIIVRLPYRDETISEEKDNE